MKRGWSVGPGDALSRPSIHTFFFGKFEFERFLPVFPSTVSAPGTVPPSPSRLVWCPKTVRHLTGHCGVPALRPVAPLTCLLATASGHGWWRKSQLERANNALPKRKKKLAISLEIYFRSAPGTVVSGAHLIIKLTGPRTKRLWMLNLVKQLFMHKMEV